MQSLLNLLARGSRDIMRTFGAFEYDFERKYWAQYFPVKPKTINLLANDICNSKCTMCMIWKQKKDKELSPNELNAILQDSLFSDVKHVGITGGEPTLRGDLDLLFEAVCESLPNLKGASSITNAINTNQVIDRITASAMACKRFGVNFSIMVSLDGVDEVHDRNRNRDGNFASAMEVIRHFRDNTDMPLSVCCTITKINVWKVDELLEFCQREGIYIRFRVAEFINRLYNEDEIEIIRNFSAEEAYHLAIFFKKLELRYEQNPKIKRTYRSIRGMLLGKDIRKIGCPYQSRAVVLDSRGQLQYCAPKSEILGNTLYESPSVIWKNNLSERQRIIRENCENCIHDYHAPITTYELIDQCKEYISRKLLNLDFALWIANLFVNHD